MVVKSSRSITSKTAPNDLKNIYKSSRKYSDRNYLNSDFPAFDVKINKISSTILLLASEEVVVVQKTLHHLDMFASLGKQSLQKLMQENLYDSVVKLCRAEDLIIKRFALKLLAQFVSEISECRKKLLSDDSLVEESKSIFMISSDDVLSEFSGILLLALCDDPKRVDSFGRDEAVLKCIFNKFKSKDSDILLQSIQLLNAIMRNSMLIESILKHKDFPIRNLQIELNSEIPEIQIAAIESFSIITSFSENPFLNILSSDRLIEGIYNLCMQKSSDIIQKSALIVFRSLCKSENVMKTLSQSDYLLKYLVEFMDKSSTSRELFLGVLTEFAKFDDNRKILYENGVIKEIIELLRSSATSEACDAIKIMSKNIFCLQEILSTDVFMLLMNLSMDDSKECQLRTNALVTFLELISIQGFKPLMELSDKIGEVFGRFLTSSSTLSFMMTSISILVKLAQYHEIKSKLAASKLGNAIFTALISSHKSTNITIQLFNLATNFIDQECFQKAFIDNDVTTLIDYNLKSPSSLLISAVCNFISASSNYEILCESMIQNKIVTALMDKLDCPLCCEAFEAILDHDLSIKFAIRGCLEANEKIESGFYATKGNWIDFETLRELISTEKLSPRNPVYTINTSTSDLKVGNRTLLRDQNFLDLVNEIKENEEFPSLELHEKIKFVAIKVSKFMQTDDDCFLHQLNLHLTELKFKLESSVIPLGHLIYGNSFEAALLFKALADQLEIDASLHVDDIGKGWNRVCDGTNVVDLVFGVGKVYEASSYEARKYFQKIS